MTVMARAMMAASTAAVVLTASRQEGVTSLPASPTCSEGLLLTPFGTVDLGTFKGELTGCDWLACQPDAQWTARRTFASPSTLVNSDHSGRDT